MVLSSLCVEANRRSSKQHNYNNKLYLSIFKKYILWIYIIKVKKHILSILLSEFLIKVSKDIKIIKEGFLQLLLKMS